MIRNLQLSRLTTGQTDTTLAKKLLLSFLMAAITGLLAQIKMPLPFTPVPVTGQSFAVLLAAVFLGRNFGSLSQIFYIIFGAAGIPWFSDMTQGISVIAGPTGGYLLGFIVMAYFLGSVLDKIQKPVGLIRLLAIMLAANLFFIFIPGLLQLAVWHRLTLGEIPSLAALLTLGFTPFIPGALFKSALAAVISRPFLNQKS